MCGLLINLQKFQFAYCKTVEVKDFFGQLSIKASEILV